MRLREDGAECRQCEFWQAPETVSLRMLAQGNYEYVNGICRADPQPVGKDWRDWCSRFRRAEYLQFSWFAWELHWRTIDSEKKLYERLRDTEKRRKATNLRLREAQAAIKELRRRLKAARAG